jgi:hypothetical protein
VLVRLKWGGGIAAVLFALLIAFYSWQLWTITVHSKHHAEHYGTGYRVPQKSEPDTPEERIAYWTIWLASFTGLLAFISMIQIWFLTRADKTARITADAAYKSAVTAESALEQTSAPYLDVVVSLKDAVIHRMVGGQTVVDLMGGDFAEYVIHNYGNSPAFVLEFYHGCIVSRTIPEKTAFPPLQTNLRKTIVVGGMREAPPIAIPFPAGGISAADANEAVWVSLQIRYRDVFMKQYISTFCLAYNQTRATFSAQGGPQYNQRRKLTDEELRIAELRDQ